MITVRGKHNEALCYCETLEETARGQIESLCDLAVFSDSKIRIMPDVHAGMGCTIGTTMTLTDRVVPGMVGVDIGCGMETVRLAERELDLQALDSLIRREIPCGREVRERPHPLHEEVDLSRLRCLREVNPERARRSIGTLGGGNHFIEVDRDPEGRLYLVVHSGSRHIGNEVALLYQEEGWRALRGGAKHQIEEAVSRLKAQGREKEIQRTIRQMKAMRGIESPVPKDLCWVEGKLFEDYIHDMGIIQRFAAVNRRAMAGVILSGLGLTAEEAFTTTHNYIDTEEMVLRKGAVSAKAGEKLLIPINMRDGSLLCVGKGNDDWNRSAPHGAGRLMSRRAALETLSLESYRAEMEGIYSTCVSRDTLDESPMAYKSMEEIVRNISPTAEIVSRVRPIYNFKASE